MAQGLLPFVYEEEKMGLSATAVGGLPVHAHLGPRQFCCAIYGVVPAHRGHLRPIGEWNFGDVVVKGSTIKFDLSGAAVVDADVSKVKKFLANHQHPGLMRTRGSFSFAGHTDRSPSGTSGSARSISRARFGRRAEAHPALGRFSCRSNRPSSPGT